MSARTAPAIGSVRSRRTFEQLRVRGARGRCGPLTVSYLKQPSWSRADFAYAVSRKVGSAVVRNRLKRRLRAIVSEQASSLPAGTYLVGAGPGGVLLEFDDLKAVMNEALEKATKRSAVMAGPRTVAQTGVLS